MPRSTTSAPKRLVTPRTSSAKFSAAEADVVGSVDSVLISGPPRTGDDSVELRVQHHREDDHDADPHVEVVRADPDQRQPILENSDQDGPDESSDHRPATAGQRGAADHARADGIEDEVDAEVARVEAPVLDGIDDPDEAGEERAHDEGPDLHASDRHSRLGGPDQISAGGNDPRAEARTREQHRSTIAIPSTQMISDHSQAPMIWPPRLSFPLGEEYVDSGIGDASASCE